MIIQLEDYFGKKASRTPDDFACFSEMKNVCLNFAGLASSQSWNFINNFNKIKCLQLINLVDGEVNFSNLNIASQLEDLEIYSSKSGLDTLSSCKNLKRLTLHRVKSSSSIFLKDLKFIEEIIIGGHFDSLDGLVNSPVRQLTLSLTSKTVQLAFLSSLKNIRYLNLIESHGVKALPNLERCELLSELKLIKMRNLLDIQGASNAKLLENLIIAECPKLNIKSVTPFCDKKNLKRISFKPNSKKVVLELRKKFHKDIWIDGEN